MGKDPSRLVWVIGVAIVVDVADRRAARFLQNGYLILTFRALFEKMELTYQERVALAAFASVKYWTCLAVYRLYLSPLSKFPGLKLAAVTLWYDFYYDVIKRGQYTCKIAEMHEQYGPLITTISHQTTHRSTNPQR